MSSFGFNAKLRAFFIWVATCFACGFSGHAYADATPVAVLVGSNQGIASRATLRYAESDARGMYRALHDVGGMTHAQLTLLLNPSPSKVLRAVDAALAQAGGGPLIVYFSGHADDRGLLTGGNVLRYAALKTRLADARAGLRIGIVDACRGGLFTGSRGISETDVFSVTPNLQPSSAGSMLIASSAGIEDAHESETVGGGFFTHHWIAALRGAADADHDGRIGISEAFAYAKTRTIRDTAKLGLTPQQASFSMQVTGRRDWPMATVASGRAQLRIDPHGRALELVALDTGLVVVETPAQTQTIRLALPPGTYFVRHLQRERVAVKEISLRAGRSAYLDARSLKATNTTESVGTKGDAHPARDWLEEPRPDGAVVARLRIGAFDGSSSLGGGFNIGTEGRPARILEGTDVAAALPVLDGLSIDLTLSAQITDELSWRFPFAFAYQWKNKQSMHTLWGGLTGADVVFDRFEEKLAISAWAGAGYDFSLDWRQSHVRFFKGVPGRHRLTMSVWASSAFPILNAQLTRHKHSGSDSGPDTLRAGIGGNYRLTLLSPWGQSTLNLGLGYSQHVLFQGHAPNNAFQWSPRIAIGSAVTPNGIWSPLASFRITPWSSLDLYGGLEYDFGTQKAHLSVGLGMTVVGND